MSAFSGDYRCANCKRSGTDIVLTYHDCRVVRRKHAKLYFAVVSRSASIGLCKECDCYLMKRGKNEAVHYWPAMIYVFLTHDTASKGREIAFETKWNLLPTTWRRWWSDEFSDRMLDHESEPLFADKTEELQNVEEAISNLKWMDLALCMDKHFAYPEVRNFL